jgi:peptide deformylase
MSMTLRKILTPDYPVLRKRAYRVTDFGGSFQSLVDDMVQTMMEAPGVGLAAPQVGIGQRVFVARIGDDEESRKEHGADAGKLFIVVNPELVKTSRDLVEGVEGCLSIPGYAGKVMRYQSVVVDAQDRHGKKVRYKPKDWLARIFQHEMDHLDGRLYIDIASEIFEAKEEDEVDAE